MLVGEGLVSSFFQLGKILYNTELLDKTVKFMIHKQDTVYVSCSTHSKNPNKQFIPEFSYFKHQWLI